MCKNGLDFAGVFDLTGSSNTYYSTINFEFSDTSIPDELSDLYFESLNCLYGFSDCGKEYMDRNFQCLAGTYPTNENEIAITKYVYDYLAAQEGSGINGVNDIIGKKYKVLFLITKFRVSCTSQVKMDR